MKIRALAISLLLSSALFSAIPSTQGTTTERDYRAALYALNKRTLADAYREVGTKNSKWDAAAIELLDGIAIRVSNSGAASDARVADEPDTEKLLSLAKS